MWDFIKMFLVAFVVFMLVEGIWLVVVAKEFYKKEIGYIMSKSPKLIPTVVFSLVFVIGLVFFVIKPALLKDSWQYALLVGIFFGLVTYSTYDLTNHANLEGWPLKVTIVDLIWGGSMSAIVSTLSFFILKMIG
nr:DUF2177 family protein [Tissierella sp.]